MNTNRPHQWLAGIFSISMGISFAAQAAESVEDFYKKNNQLTIIVGYAAGTGYEVWARIIAQYMPKYLPGHPSMIVKTMPGAGSLTAANFLGNQAPKDGTSFGTFSRNLPSQVMLGLDNVRFDPRTLSYIGSPESQPSVVCAAMTASGVTTVEEAQKKELLLGGVGVASGSSVLPMVINQLAGTKFKLIEGYQGSTEIYLAMQRGEVGGHCQGYAPLYAGNQQLIQNGQMKILFNFESKRQPYLEGVPSIFEYIKDPESLQILAFINSSTELGRPFAAPAGVPSDRMAALRKAFEDAMKDPELVATAAKAQMEYGLVTGPELERLVQRLYAIPKPIVDKANTMMPKGASGG